jgi:hypothetical protein
MRNRHREVDSSSDLATFPAFPGRTGRSAPHLKQRAIHRVLARSPSLAWIRNATEPAKHTYGFSWAADWASIRADLSAATGSPVG